MKSLLKAMAVLSSFTPASPKLTPKDIASLVRIPLPTAYRILVTLSQGGFVEYNTQTRKYTIGPSLYVLGSLYLNTTDITKAAELLAKEMNALTGEAVSVGIFDRGNAVVILKEETRRAFRFATHVGSIFPAYASSMGRAFLSEMTNAEIDNLYPQEALAPLTNKTIKTKSDLQEALKEVRRTGVAIDVEGVYDGVYGMSSPVRNATGKVVAVVAISVSTLRMNDVLQERLSTLLRMGASLVSYRLGYHDSSNQVHNVQQMRDWWEESAGPQNDDRSEDRTIT